MSSDNPYRAIARAYADLLHAGAAAKQATLCPPERIRAAADTPKALIFSPHPDDECIVGGLPLRLLRELRMNIINVAVTQGSRKDRQAERWRELQDACAYIGFGLLATAANGLEHINLNTRRQQPQTWAAAVDVIVSILETEQPAIIFMPHDKDWNSTHIGVHYLVVDALSCKRTEFSCLVVETEFWGAMATPNLMVESSVEEVADLMAALSLHRGEVARNPYHLRLPAWMADNVRRGSEVVQGQGEATPDMTFATLYRLRRWSQGAWRTLLKRGRVLASGDTLDSLFANHQQLNDE